MRTREIARPGDFGAFITSSEWMDVNYGSLLRNMLADGLGGTALHVLSPSAHPFGDALTTGVIACFRVGDRPEKFTVRAVTTLDELKPLAKGKPLASFLWRVRRLRSQGRPLHRPGHGPDDRA